MAVAPVISNIQGIPGGLQWVPFGFQPAATNSPTSWSALGLPPGMSIDSGTGLISGAASLPGVYVVTVTASNTAGSNTAQFTVGIEAAAPSLSTDVDVTWDIVANKVTGTAGVPPDGAAASPLGAPLTLRKYGDDLILSITLQKAASVLDLDITGVSNAVKVSIKERDGDGVLVTSDAFAKLGTGSNARYRVHVPLTGPALLGALSDFQDDTETKFSPLCEIELIYNNPTYGTFGAATLQLRSDTFLIALAASFA